MQVNLALSEDTDAPLLSKEVVTPPPIITTSFIGLGGSGDVKRSNSDIPDGHTKQRNATLPSNPSLK